MDDGGYKYTARRLRGHTVDPVGPWDWLQDVVLIRITTSHIICTVHATVERLRDCWVTHNHGHEYERIDFLYDTRFDHQEESTWCSATYLARGYYKDIYITPLASCAGVCPSSPWVAFILMHGRMVRFWGASRFIVAATSTTWHVLANGVTPIRTQLWYGSQYGDGSRTKQKIWGKERTFAYAHQHDMRR